MRDGTESSSGGTEEVPVPEGPGIRSVLRAIDLLALFTEERAHWTIRELTDASGLAKTTVIRLISTLEQRGLLSSSGGRVSPGPGLLKWSGLARSSWRLPESAVRVMTDLAQRCGETVNLYVRSDISRVCVAQQEGPRNLRHVVRVGDELPLWAGAASSVLLTNADEPLLRRIASASPRGIASLEDLRSRIAAAREAGYALSHGERELGASGLSAPVVGDAGQVLAALGLGGPTGRFCPDRIGDLSTAVLEAACSMSRLGPGRGMFGGFD